MKILIVDDEVLARERLSRLIAELNLDYLVSQAENGLTALQMYHKIKPQVILLDIHMPLMDGIEVAQHLNKLTSPPAIIFTTAYSNHALQAFNVHAVDYLMKPIRKNGLEQALSRAKKLGNTEIASLKNNTMTANYRTHLSMAINGQLKLVPIESIYFLRATQKYVTAVWPQGELLISDSLKTLEQEFAANFIRIHRNTLVALKYIQMLGKDDKGNPCIELQTMKTRLPISRRHLHQVRNALKHL